MIDQEDGDYSKDHHLDDTSVFVSNLALHLDGLALKWLDPEQREGK